ncbi:MAG: restriction endonuclease subunit S [Nitrospirae bacterium]|nr:restriction endonuclease subunit S [Nitrospirota bacterium]
MSKRKTVKLGDLAAEGRSVISGPFGSNIGKRYFQNEGVPVIRGNNLTTDYRKFIDEGFVFLTKEKANELNSDAIEGDLIFTAAGTIGQVGIIPKDAKYKRYTISNKQLRFRVDTQKADPDFIYAWLASPWILRAITNRDTGSTVPLINLGIIRSLPVILPEDISEQKKIAAVLSALDTKIDCNNRINAELEAMAKTLYDYWFVQFEFPDANGKPYKSSGGKMEYNSTLKREIPAGWGAIQLNELLQSRTDSITASELDSGSPYTPIDALPMKKMSFGVAQPSSEANTSLIQYKENDILIGAMRVYFHRVCIAPFDGVTRTTVIVLRANEPNHLPYLYQVCNEDRTINIASKMSVGTQQPYVNWENALENHAIPHPENDTLVQKYSSMLLSVTKDVINREKENAELAKLRDWLLPMLMNGQVTVA